MNKYWDKKLFYLYRRKIWDKILLSVFLKIILSVITLFHLKFTESNDIIFVEIVFFKLRTKPLGGYILNFLYGSITNWRTDRNSVKVIMCIAY